MDDQLKAQVLAEVLEFGSAPLAQPGDFTKTDYIKGWQEKHDRLLPLTTAQSHLERMISKGLLVKERALLEGKLRTVYRRVREDE